eukprot:2481446-Prymnesium_polylepis.1
MPSKPTKPTKEGPRPLPNETAPSARLRARRLERAGFGMARFVPAGDEVLGSIFTWWNVLDALMSVHSMVPWQTGYMRELQLRRMLELVRAPSVRHYCEVGMNGGHSAVAMLVANPHITAHVFDPLEYQYSQPVASLLRASFGERFRLTPGYSRKTLPSFVRSLARNGSSCDVLLVDGDHTEPGTRFDINTLGAAVHASSALVVDDTVPVCLPSSVTSQSGAPFAVDEADEASYCDDVRAVAAQRKNRRDPRILGPGWAVRKLASAGRMHVTERYGPFAMGTEVNPCFRTTRRQKCRSAGDIAGDAACSQWCGAPHEFDWGFVVARYTDVRGTARRSA